MKLLCTLVLTLFTVNILSAQDLTNIKGTVLSANDESPLLGATVRLISLKDTTVVKGAYADRAGLFKVKDVPLGAYRLSITYVGYRKLESTTFVRSTTDNLGTFRLNIDTINNTAVQVEANAIRAEVRGDTVD